MLAPRYKSRPLIDANQKVKRTSSSPRTGSTRLGELSFIRLAVGTKTPPRDPSLQRHPDSRIADRRLSAEGESCFIICRVLLWSRRPSRFPRAVGDPSWRCLSDSGIYAAGIWWVSVNSEFKWREDLNILGVISVTNPKVWGGSQLPSYYSSRSLKV